VTVIPSASTGPVATSAPVAPAGSAPEDLRKAAQAFEAIFLRQLLSSARAADFGGDDLFGGPGLEQFEAMRDEHFADVASQQGVFGLAAAIERQVAALTPPPAAGS
jgi:peptidoglycan hydrolase FlgJ